MPRKKPKSSQKQKQKQSITINVGQKAPRRTARPRVPPQLPRGQMPSFSFGSTHIQPQSKEPMFRELYEQEKQKVHFLKQNVEVNRLAVAHAQTDNRQVQMATVAESEHVRVNMNNRPRVSSHLDRFQQQEIESLGEPMRRIPEQGSIIRNLWGQMDAVESARPPLEDDEVSELSERSQSGLFHDRKESKSVFSLHANEDASSSIPEAEDIGQRDDPILSHHVNTPSALSVAIDESNQDDEDTKYGADEDGEGSTNASHKISNDGSPVEPYDSEASKHALFAEMKEDEKRTQGIALADRGTPGQRLNLFEGISGRASHFLKLPDTAESKTPVEIETPADAEPKGNSLEKQSQSKKDRNPGVGLGSGNARGLREGPLKQLGRPANISPMHADPVVGGAYSEAVSFF